MEFGDILRDLRTKAGLGIKKLGPELDVTYSYISKLENNELRPSEEFIQRVSEYFGYDNDRLLLAAGKVPTEVLEILRDHPEEAVAFLREHFGRRRNERPATRSLPKNY